MSGALTVDTDPAEEREKTEVPTKELAEETINFLLPEGMSVMQQKANQDLGNVVL